MAYELKLFSGNANRPLAEEIAQHLRIRLGDVDVSRFSDGEVYVQINENVRGEDVFVIQPTCPPVNDTLMELLVMMDALKRASARRITAVLPYYGYGRQDRKVMPRVPITAKLVADLITAAGCHRLLAVDLHAGQIQGFFNIPVDHLFAAPPVIVDYLAKKDLQDLVLVSPDAGGVERARAIAKRLNAGLAIIDKRRDGPNVALFMYLIGDVKNKDVVVIDDMIDTAGTLIQAVEAVKREGARRVLACAVHGVLSGPALKRIEESPLEEVTIAVDPRDVFRIIHGREGSTQLLKLTFAGSADSKMAILRDMQFDPVSEDLIHVDLQEVAMDKPIQVTIAVHHVGDAVGVRETQGILEMVLREIQVSCLPGNIPEAIEADVSNLAIGDVLTVGDLPIPDGVRVLTDRAQAVATVAPPAAEEVARRDHPPRQAAMLHERHGALHGPRREEAPYGGCRSRHRV